MSQLSLSGPSTPPDLKLRPRQRFALEILFETPLSSEELGARLHERRQAEGGRGHLRHTRCDWCKPEGAGMGNRLRELGLVRFSRKLDLWYTLEKGMPDKPKPEIDRGAQTDEIPF